MMVTRRVVVGGACDGRRGWGGNRVWRGSVQSSMSTAEGPRDVLFSDRFLPALGRVGELLHCRAMRRRDGWKRLIRGLVVLSVALGLVGCGAAAGIDPDTADDEIDAVLRAYYPKLAEAYAEGDPFRLEGYAVQKEIAAVALQIKNNDERGERIHSTLEQFTIESLTVDRTTVFVNTLEVWDIERRALGSDVVLRAYPGLRYKVRYQIKKENEQWRVFFRVSERLGGDGALG